jgi:dihydrofolate reductase
MAGAQLAGDIVIAASFQLVHPLLEHDLVDELRLMIYPVVLGSGRRMFGETSDKKPMRLVGNRTVDGDLAYLTYERVRDALLPLRRRPRSRGTRWRSKRAKERRSR